MPPSLYVVAPRAQPWNTVFVARSLDEAAAAVAAQPDPGALVVFGNQDVSSFDLSPDDQARLDALMAGLSSPAPRA